MSKNPKVQHDLEDFTEGQNIILTLKDQQLLKGDQLVDDPDILINEHLLERDKLAHKDYLKKNLTKLSSASTSHLEAKHQVSNDKSILPHYDEIKWEKEGFELDEKGNFANSQFEQELKHKQEISLEENQIKYKVANEYLSKEPNKAFIKKRKMFAGKDPLQVLYQLEEENVKQKKLKQSQKEPEQRKIVNWEEEDDDLNLALQRAIQLKSKDAVHKKATPEEQVTKILNELGDVAPVEEAPEATKDDKLLSINTEFFQSINNTIKENQETKLLTQKIQKQKKKNNPEGEGETITGGEAEIQAELDEIMKEVDSNDFIKEELYDQGLAITLKKLRERGYLGDQDYDYKGRANDKKPFEEDFKEDPEKDGVTLEYRDQKGRIMTKKQAFRYMCYIFHGKKPGRHKLEKIKRQELAQEQKRQVSIGENPLMKALKMKQAQSQQSYLVLSQPKND